MDINAIGQLISTIGFPITACIYMLVYMRRTIDKNTEATNNLSTVVGILASKLGVELTHPAEASAIEAAKTSEGVT